MTIMHAIPFLSFAALLIGSTLPAQNLIVDPGFEESDNLQSHWTLGQFVPGLATTMTLSTQSPGDGNRCLQVDNENWSEGSPTYLLELPPGDYHIGFSARTEPGHIRILQGWLGGQGYTNWSEVSERWQRVEANVTLTSADRNLTIRPRAGSGTFFIDDVTVTPGHREITPPNYPEIELTERPTRQKTLLFSPVNVVEFGDQAQWFADRGIAGALLLYVTSDNFANPWERNGEAVLQEVLKCNRQGRAVGVDSNFIVISFHKPFPPLFDAEQVKNNLTTFRETARFAALSESRGVALDFEYILDSYPLYQQADFNTEGRDAKRYLERAYDYGKQVAEAMYDEFPAMELLIVWENSFYAGALSGEMLHGIFDVAAKRNAPGGISVLTEMTYHETRPGRLLEQADNNRKWIMQCAGANPTTAEYAAKHIDVAIGMSPIGRSYQDNDLCYSPEEFARQLAAARASGGRYNWLYTWGNTFSPQDDASVRQYSGKTAYRYWPAEPPVVPPPPELEEFCRILKSNTALKEVTQP